MFIIEMIFVEMNPAHLIFVMISALFGHNIMSPKVIFIKRQGGLVTRICT